MMCHVLYTCLKAGTINDLIILPVDVTQKVQQNFRNVPFKIKNADETIVFYGVFL